MTEENDGQARVTTFFCAICRVVVEQPHHHPDVAGDHARPVAFVLVSEAEAMLLLENILPRQVEIVETWKVAGWQEQLEILKDLQRKLEDVRLWYRTARGEVQGDVGS